MKRCVIHFSSYLIHSSSSSSSYSSSSSLRVKDKNNDAIVWIKDHDVTKMIWMFRPWAYQSVHHHQFFALSEHWSMNKRIDLDVSYWWYTKKQVLYIPIDMKNVIVDVKLRLNIYWTRKIKMRRKFFLLLIFVVFFSID